MHGSDEALATTLDIPTGRARRLRHGLDITSAQDTDANVYSCRDDLLVLAFALGQHSSDRSLARHLGVMDFTPCSIRGRCRRPASGHRHPPDGDDMLTTIIIDTDPAVNEAELRHALGNLTIATGHGGLAAITIDGVVSGATIVLDREQLETWAGRPLSDDQIARLEACLGNSTVPMAIATIAENLTE